MDNMDFMPVVFYWMLFVAIGFFIFIYLWACKILADFAEQNKKSGRRWFFLSVIFTPLFAPSLFFFVQSQQNYFMRVFYSTLVGLGFTFFFIPYKMLSYFVLRAIGK